jgi:predicted 3-demethylubiquinone-9 3-methyltransferase (glyoxalase superfamily)
MEKQPGSQQKITPFLWFDNQAEEAMHFYVSIFKNSKINSVVRNAEGAPGPKGAVMTVSFTLNGQDFVALNGGPHFKFTEAVSFVVNCETQDEIDTMWEQLSAGGEEGRCGWLKDKFGLSWQIVPPLLPKLLKNPDPEKAKRVLAAMMKMKKISIPTLIQAAEEELPAVEQIS